MNFDSMIDDNAKGRYGGEMIEHILLSLDTIDEDTDGLNEILMSLDEKEMTEAQFNLKHIEIEKSVIKSS